MKKISELLAMSMLLLITSCNSRKAEIQKYLSENQTKTSLYEKQISDLQSQIIEKITSENTKQSKIDSLSKKLISLKSENENLSKKLSEENSSEAKTKVSKSKEYFENGSVKFETESSETESKVLAKKNQEIDYWKASAIETKEELTKVNLELASSEKSIFDFSQKNKLLTNLATNQQKKIKNLESEKNKNTEKKGLSWYWISLISVLAWELFKVLWKKLKQGNFYSNFLEQLNRKR